MTALPCEAAPPRGPAADLAARLRALVPVLTTERLTLRALTMDDFPLVAEIATGPRAAGIGGPMSREDAWYEFAQMNMTWLVRGHGYWAVTDTASGELLGFAGIGFEPGDREPELGYFFSAAAEGRGLASEAVARARDWGFADAALETLVSYVLVHNSRSIALAERLGAVRDGDITDGSETLHVFRHNRPKALQ